MGIRRLTQYVEDLPHGKGKVWDNFDLRETKVVIDGNGLYHYIYSDINHLNTKYGGQYDEFQVKMKDFFRKLQSNNVEPYVVIDGIMSKDEKKLKTHIKRKTETIEQVEKMWKFNKSDDETNRKVFPLLAQLVFVQVLREMKVHYAVADFEADWEIASLANELDAPVMGKDSDFYIFNIKDGYIPFEEFFTSQNTRVKKFSFDGFVQYLEQEFAIDSEMLPLLASLLGNDYISGGLLRKFHDWLKLDTNSKKVPYIASFLSQYQSISDACGAVIELYQNDDSAEFAEALSLSIEEYQKTGSNLIHYFNSGSLSCNVRTYNGHPLPQWVVKLYREGLIASEGLNCLCNRKIFLRPQSEDVSLPSTQICAEGLRRYYYKLALNLETQTQEYTKAYKNTSSPLAVLEKFMIYREIYHTQFKTTSYGTTPSTSFVKQNHTTTTLESKFAHKVNVGENAMKSGETGLPSKWNKSIQDIEVNKTENPPQAASNLVKYTNFTDSTTVIEFDRNESTLAEKKVNLTPNTEPQIHDIPKMSGATKQRQLLWLLYSDLPSICGLPIEHRLVASALRYWAFNSKDLEPAHLAAILVYYVGKTPSKTTSDKNPPISIHAFHGFSQWQNVLYWVERLNALFSSPFPTPELAKLYDGVHVCWLYETLKKEGIWFAENIVINETLYRNLYERITNDLGSDWQI